jgi:hypothetical protein
MVCPLAKRHVARSWRLVAAPSERGVNRQRIRRPRVAADDGTGLIVARRGVCRRMPWGPSFERHRVGIRHVPEGPGVVFAPAVSRVGLQRVEPGCPGAVAGASALNWVRCAIGWQRREVAWLRGLGLGVTVWSGGFGGASPGCERERRPEGRERPVGPPLRRRGHRHAPDRSRHSGNVRRAGQPAPREGLSVLRDGVRGATGAGSRQEGSAGSTRDTGLATWTPRPGSGRGVLRSTWRSASCPPRARPLQISLPSRE